MSTSWVESLRSLRSKFEDGAAQFRDLECAVALCKCTPPPDKKRICYSKGIGIDREGIDKYFDKCAYPPDGRIPVSEHENDFDKEGTDAPAWIIRFYGSEDGADQFLKFAESASGGLRGHKERFKTEEQRKLARRSGPWPWLRLLFETAWACRDGSALQLPKTFLAGNHPVTHVGVLPLNPFTASMLLIDELLGEAGDEGHEDQPSVLVPENVPSWKVRIAGRKGLR